MSARLGLLIVRAGPVGIHEQHITQIPSGQRAAPEPVAYGLLRPKSANRGSSSDAL